MGQSLVQNYIHIVFSTKSRKPLISENIENQLHDYLGGIANKLECQVLKVGGHVDHIHILCCLSKKIALVTLVEKLKVQSSKWVKTLGTDFNDFYWQDGYGAFSVKPSDVLKVSRYIQRQRIHHKDLSFMDEYRRMLISCNIPFNEKYVWD
jgi:REP element-mobilizing transposase RayT